MAKTKLRINLKQTLPYMFIVAGIIGAVASFVLTFDKIQVLKDPSYNPSCNINPILSCGSIMNTEQASLLGVPNTMFGVAAFSVLITLGVVLLAGAKFNRWLWLLINAGAAAGFGFFLYLFFQAVYRVNAICPYCFVVWLIVPPLLWYITLYNLRENNLRLSFIKPKFKQWLLSRHIDILVLWYLVFFGILLYEFWYYWKTLI